MRDGQGFRDHGVAVVSAAVRSCPLVPVLVVSNDFPAKNVKELTALAKARPGQLSYASSGNGAINHLAGELFKMRTGTDIVHIPYKGGGPAAVALLSGEVGMIFGEPNFDTIGEFACGETGPFVLLLGDPLPGNDQHLLDTVPDPLQPETPHLLVVTGTPRRRRGTSEVDAEDLGHGPFPGPVVGEVDQVAEDEQGLAGGHHPP